MNTALYGCDPKESRIEIIAKWVLTILLALILTLGIISESQAGTSGPPIFTSSDMVSVPENQTSALDVQSNEEGNIGVSYSLNDGADEAFFNLDANLGY